ncbi:MAG: class I adenylate-forming enzyme family protein [Acidimicrobiales bacterium]
MNIAGFVDAPAGGDPDRLALILDDGTSCTYGALRAEVDAWAATLAGLGVGRSDRVAIVDWGGVRSTAVTLAAAHIGGASAHINPLLTAPELDALTELAHCAPFTVGRSVTEPDRGVPAPPLVDDADEALVLFTSGTTGLPKPVSITHRGLAARVKAYAPPFSADRPPNVSIMGMPSFHVGGLVGLLLSLYGGNTTVVQPRFDAGRWLELVEAHHVVSAMLVPTMLARILDHPSFASTDLSSLKLISYGAAAAPVELVARAMAALPGAGFANVFGQTETLGAYTTLTPDDHRDPRRIGSVGRAMPGVEIKIVDAESGATLDAGEVGELWVSSPLNVSPGWLQTGDLARVDADGYVYPAGRRSDTINRGGEKFGPSEIAAVVSTHPAVADAAVAGVRDDEMGERVGVAVVTRAGASPPTTEELRAWCRERLAPFKLPEVVVHVDALPYNELGKLPRRTVAQFIEERA